MAGGLVFSACATRWCDHLPEQHPGCRVGSGRGSCGGVWGVDVDRDWVKQGVTLELGGWAPAGVLAMECGQSGSQVGCSCLQWWLPPGSGEVRLLAQPHSEHRVCP